MSNNKQLEQELTALRAQGVDEQSVQAYAAMKRSTSQDVPMSSSDSVVIRQSQADAPGIYLSADQLAQQNYNNQIMSAQAGMAKMQQFPGPAVQTYNPNYRTETEGQNRTVKPDGTVVIY